jgi:hypothetical protein
VTGIACVGRTRVARTATKPFVPIQVTSEAAVAAAVVGTHTNATAACANIDDAADHRIHVGATVVVDTSPSVVHANVDSVAAHTIHVDAIADVVKRQENVACANNATAVDPEIRVDVVAAVVRSQTSVATVQTNSVVDPNTRVDANVGVDTHAPAITTRSGGTKRTNNGVNANAKPSRYMWRMPKKKSFCVANTNQGVSPTTQRTVPFVLWQMQRERERERERERRTW